MFDADGFREVDQVPILIDKQETGVDPRDIAATDAAGLGNWMSLYDFKVQHRVGSITAPEHCILSYFLVIRFASVTEDDVNPLAIAHTAPPSYIDLVGDPELLAASPPSSVRVNQLFNNNSTNILGTLPAGWQYRAGWNNVGQRVDIANNFPIYGDAPTSAANCRDASRINPAFRTTALGDFMIDLYFNEPSWCDTPGAMASYMAGDAKGSKEFIDPTIM